MRWLSKIGLLFLLATPAFANQAATGFCQVGGVKVVTSGLNSTNSVQGSFPSCTVTVNVVGGGLATIFSDNIGTPLANPFTAGTNGSWTFYAANGHYSVTLTATGLNYTVSDILLNDPAAAGSTFTGSSVTSSTANPAATGFIRMAKTDALCWRNNGNTADKCFTLSGAGDLLTWSSALTITGAFTGTTGTFSGGLTGTTLSLSGDITAATIHGSGGLIDNTPIGSITPAAGSFTTGLFSGPLTGLGATFSAEVAPNVTGVALGDTGHRWDAFIRNLDISGVISGVISATAINLVQMCEEFPGSDGGQKLQACINAAEASGGIADAYGFGQTQQTISGTVTVGTAAHPVRLLIDHTSTRWTCTITNGTACIDVNNASFLDCGGVGQQQGGGSTAAGFYLGSSANVSALIENGTQDGTQEYVHINGCLFQGNQAATVSKGIMYINSVFVPSLIENNTVISLTSAPAILTEGSSDLLFHNNWINAASGIPCNATVMPGMVIRGGSGPYHIIGGALEHSCNAPILKIDGTTGKNSPGHPQVNIAHIGLETQTGGGNGIESTDVWGLHIQDVSITGNVAGTDFLKIINSGGGTADIKVENLPPQATFTNLINDTQHSIVRTGSTLQEWHFPETGASNNNKQEIETGDVAFGWQATGILGLFKPSSSGPNGPTQLQIFNSNTAGDVAGLGFSGDTKFRINLGNGRHFVIGLSGAGGDAWQINNAANPALLAITDGQPDIGASGANRPNNIFLKNSVVVGNNGAWTMSNPGTNSWKLSTPGGSTSVYFNAGSPAFAINRNTTSGAIDNSGLAALNLVDSASSLDFNMFSGAGASQGTVMQMTVGGLLQTPQNTKRLTSDFTLAANTSLQTITGFSWTLDATTARNYSFHCSLKYSQATAAVSDAFGVQAATNNPTNLSAMGIVYTAAATSTSGDSGNITTTTATNVLTFTPSATGTVFVAILDGTIENPGATANTLNVMASQSNSGDLLTIKRGSFCQVF